jgi:hypothetical protein
MTLNGVKDLIPFLDILDSKRVTYSLSRERSGTVMVTTAVVGARIEIDFFDDHIEYSVFRGNEDVLGDQPALFKMLRDFYES